MLIPNTNSSDQTALSGENPNELWAHDMRAAIGGVTGGLALIDQSMLSADTKLNFSQANIAAQMLLNLVNALNTADGNTNGEADSVMLLAELEKIEVRWRAEANAKGIDFNFDAPKNDATISVSLSDFQRIFSNLIGNAFKFTSAGTVSVSFRVEGATMTAIIADSGGGFSQQALEKLFLLHGRPSDAKANGTGLGLFIAKQIVDAANGSITIENQQSIGAAITVSLPCKPEIPKTAKPVSAPKSNDLPDLSHLNILLAEDNLTNQMVVKQMLTSMNANFVMASDGVEAMQLFDSGDFDIGLIDIEMPRMSGLEVMRAIRQRSDAKAAIILVALTAYVLPEHQERIRAAGASGLISKPLSNVADFGRSILSYADKSTGPNDTTAATSTKPEAIINLEIYNGLEQMIGQESMTELLGKVKNDIESVRLGVAEGIKSQNSETISAKTHILISVAGAIGAVSLQNVAQSLNALSKTENWAAIDEGAKKCVLGCELVLDFVDTKLQES